MHKAFMNAAYECTLAIQGGDVQNARSALYMLEGKAKTQGERIVCHDLANAVQRLMFQEYEAQA